MFQTINPSTNQALDTYPTLTDTQLQARIDLARRSYRSYWSVMPVQQRAEKISQLAQLLEDQQERLGRQISLEMGKPYLQAQKEIEKCARLCRYFATHGPAFLADEPIPTEYQKSYLHFQPIGGVLGVMPWNFPFWQAFRFAIPAMLAGNVAFLKPAPNVAGCGLAIEELITQAAGQEGVFQTLLLDVDLVPKLIADPFLQGVALTGSDRAGAAVASEAGRHIKKVVLELGGSDPFLVLDDADLEQAISTAVKSRTNNSGQTCIAAKRFIVQQSVAEAFTEGIVAAAKNLRVGDPFDEDTNIGPMARRDLLEKLDEQVQQAINAGAKVLLAGGPQDDTGNFYRPVVLTGITPDMRAYREELFGPVFSIYTVDTEEEAIALANATDYGLGAAVFSNNVERAERVARALEAGALTINRLVSSDVRIPFGGIKRSGFGRELGAEGIREFVNIKSIVVA